MSSIQPWYKQVWPWVLILLPTCAIVASVYTLYLAAANSPDLVAEDYYKKGKGINQDLTRLDNAFALALKFELLVNDNELTLTQRYGEKQNAALKLRFIHRTLKANDFELLLTADASGRYRKKLEQPLTGKWTIQIEPFDANWRIQSVDTFPSDIPTLFDSFDRR